MFLSSRFRVLLAFHKARLAYPLAQISSFPPLRLSFVARRKGRFSISYYRLQQISEGGLLFKHSE